MLTLYGMGGSQPSRAVWWTCLIKELPFELREADLTQLGPGGSLARFNPTGQMPTIADSDFLLYEMPAILCYLCDKHGWEDLYPHHLETRALVDQYLHFHHNRTRRATMDLMAPHVTVAFVEQLRASGRNELADRATHPDKLARGQAVVREISRLIERACFRDGSSYLCADHPTIADIACYEELAQLRWAGLFDFGEFAQLSSWLDAMAQLPRHDHAHRYNFTMGNIVDEPNTIERRLASRAASLEALAELGVEVGQLDDLQPLLSVKF